MLASMKRQFVELLSDIGFLKKSLSARELEKVAKDGGDGVMEATGFEVSLSMFLVSNFGTQYCYLAMYFSKFSYQYRFLNTW
jgi:hypothetical protein